MSSASTRSVIRKSSHTSSHFNSDDMTENDIEQIWKSIVKCNKRSNRKSTAQIQLVGSSVETTPTTDYGNGLIPLHPETEEEALEQDKKISRMNSVLKAKKLHPKSYLPQVILYDNVSHERILAMRLAEIREAYLAAENRAKKREETFVKSLERKQKEWMKRDARIIEKLEPENISEFNFTFGRLYSKPDYPYQSVVEAFYDIQPKSRKHDHARRRPVILPQVTNKPVYDDEVEDETFITKLSKLSSFHQVPLTRRQLSNEMSSSIKTKEAAMARASENHYLRQKTSRCGRSKKKTTEKNWMNDKRFHTLTSLLEERYSPHSQLEKLSNAAV